MLEFEGTMDKNDLLVHISQANDTHQVFDLSQLQHLEHKIQNLPDKVTSDQVKSLVFGGDILEQEDPSFGYSDISFGGLVTHSRELDAFKMRSRQQSEQLEESFDRMSELEDAYSAKKQELELSIEENQKLIKSLEKLKEELEVTNNRLEQLQIDYEQTTQEWQNAKKQTGQLMAQKTILQLEKDELERVNHDQRQDMNRQRIIASQITEQNKDLEQQLRSLKLEFTLLIESKKQNEEKLEEQDFHLNELKIQLKELEEHNRILEERCTEIHVQTCDQEVQCTDEMDRLLDKMLDVEKIQEYYMQQCRLFYNQLVSFKPDLKDGKLMVDACASKNQDTYQVVKEMQSQMQLLQDEIKSLEAACEEQEQLLHLTRSQVDTRPPEQTEEEVAVCDLGIQTDLLRELPEIEFEEWPAVEIKKKPSYSWIWIVLFGCVYQLVWLTVPPLKSVY